MRKLVQTFVDELKAGVPLKGGAGDGDDSAAPGATEAAARSSGADGAKAAASPATAAPAAAAAAANGASAAAGGSTKAGSSSRARLELEQRFYCRCVQVSPVLAIVPYQIGLTTLSPAHAWCSLLLRLTHHPIIPPSPRPSDLYECFTVEGRVCAFTQSPATVDARPGGSFSWFNGSVQGTFTALAPPSRIEMEWRFSNWAEGCTSKVVIMLEEPDTGNTVLRLVQTGIPEEDAYGNHDVKLQVGPRARAAGSEKDCACAAMLAALACRLRRKLACVCTPPMYLHAPTSSTLAVATASRPPHLPLHHAAHQSRQVERGWEGQVLSRIRQVFGFGA